MCSPVFFMPKCDSNCDDFQQTTPINPVRKNIDGCCDENRSFEEVTANHLFWNFVFGLVQMRDGKWKWMRFQSACMGEMNEWICWRGGGVMCVMLLAVNWFASWRTRPTSTLGWLCTACGLQRTSTNLNRMLTDFFPLWGPRSEVLAGTLTLRPYTQRPATNKELFSFCCGLLLLMTCMGLKKEKKNNFSRVRHKHRCDKKWCQ